MEFHPNRTINVGSANSNYLRSQVKYGFHSACFHERGTIFMAISCTEFDQNRTEM
jgi:hypothetical protein